MRITFLGYGTRGDVQPMIALGRELSARGHAVRIVAGATFSTWIEGYGLEAVASVINPVAIMEGPLGREWIEHGTNPLRLVRTMRQLVELLGAGCIDELRTMAETSDVLISSFMVDAFALSLSEQLHRPVVRLLFQPVVRHTRAGWVLPQAPRPRAESWLNWLWSRIVVEPFSWTINRRMVNAMRRDMQLPALTQRSFQAMLDRAPTVLAYSPLVLPQPMDWPATHHTTGYLFLDEGSAWTPPVELETFLDAGSPPVGIGFGSTVGVDPEATMQLVLDAVGQTGQRAVVLGGWGGVSYESSADVFWLTSAPHDWLFPRLAAVVHHGGAGTTAAALRAGVPQILVPHMGDQLLWGREMAALGVSPAAISRPQLSVERMAAALRAAQAPAMRERAAEVGAAVRSESGVMRTAAIIEQIGGAAG